MFYNAPVESARLELENWMIIGRRPSASFDCDLCECIAILARSQWSRNNVIKLPDILLHKAVESAQKPSAKILGN